MKACENCGKCCMGSPCGMAEKHGMTSTYGGRCPALVRSSGKYWCGLVLNAEGQEKAVLAHALKIGEGCHLWA